MVVELLLVGVADRLLADIPVAGRLAVDILAAGSTAGTRMESLELMQGIGMGSKFDKGCMQGMEL